MIFDLLDTVPDYDQYPMMAEIIDHTRSLEKKAGFRVEEIGRSRLGRKIDMVSFGTGKKPAILLSGFEDPHEPICSLSIMWICLQLADTHSPIHDLDYDWAIIPCLNQDGALRNEHWFQYPGDLRAFLNGSYEDEVAFWGAPQHPEEFALEKAIVRIKPELGFGMHDESHFPGHGYWALVSDEDIQGKLGDHFEYESRIGVEPVPPLVESKVMRNNWYFKRAYELNNRYLSMICEPRAYRQLTPPREAPDKILEQYKAALAEYESLLGDVAPSSEDDKALIRCAIACRDRMREERLFAICVGACGLRVMKAHGNEGKAESIEKAFWDYLKARLDGTYTVIPIRDQVRIQLHFLFSVIEQVKKRII